MSLPPAGGPSGTAEYPPSWLTDARLPIRLVSAGTPLYRVHQRVHGPLFFGPEVNPATGLRGPPTYRFDSASGAFGVLYCAPDFEGAFAETVMRNPRMRLVSRSYLRLRAVTELRSRRDLRLVDLSGAGLSAVGLHNDISTGPYGPCQAWTEFLWSHRNQPDGIAYRSRHNPELVCFAIFERADMEFTAGPSSPFAEMMPDLEALIRRYGKIPSGR